MKDCVDKIFSINAGHDASVTYLVDGNIQWMIEEERYSHRKHDEKPYLTITKSSDIDPTSVVLLTMLHHPDIPEKSKEVEDTCNVLTCKTLKRSEVKYKNCSDQHHLHHAAIGFYNSGFEDAVCLIVDGAGAFIDDCGHEVETIYKASYPCTFEKLHQRSVPWSTKVDTHTLKNPTTGIGMVYSGVAHFLGFGHLGSGSLMGLTPFGKENPNIKSFLTADGEVDETLWKRIRQGTDFVPYDYLKGNIPVFDALKDPTKKFQHLCDLAYRVQRDFETYMINLIKKAIELSGCKNIVLSGGCALNCVANYEYLKHLPEGVKLFVEPICYDAGVSAGQAMLQWRWSTQSVEIKPLNNLYLGPERQHEIPQDAYDVSLSDVVDVIESGEAVAIFQGRSEQGPRALGNRSLLFDPRIPDARFIMNDIKGREPFRPFAATVMLDHVNDWFDMRGLEDSPFMMYAIDSLPEVHDIIPGVLHVDKTCRIQTLTREQNKNYYDLIEEFYTRTKVPMLLNTSFNLSGDTICETIDDAISTLQRSKINYLYLLECGKMVHIPENSNAGLRGKINYAIYR